LLEHRFDSLQILGNFLVADHKLLHSANDLLEILVLLIMLLLKECCDQVNDSLLILDRLNVRVVQDESEMGFDLNHLLDLVVVRERLPHNCDQHVKEVEAKHEGRHDEEEPEDGFLRAVAE